VAGIGEVLIDVFENGQTTLGGAPFNVTFTFITADCAIDGRSDFSQRGGK